MTVDNQGQEGSPEANARDRLVVALDTGNALRGGQLVEQLGEAVSFYKIGLGMLTGGGLALANELKADGKRVFLDLKLFDIPQTIEAAVRGLAMFEPDFLTVHGDPHIVRAARRGALRNGEPAALRILAVTVLTSLARRDLDSMLIRPGAVETIVTERARQAFIAGADGVIASGHEAAAIRALPEAAGKLVVTPGIRLAGDAEDDQKRVMTPAAAIRAGADHIVVGRSILGAASPRRAAEEVQREIREHLLL